VTTPAKKPGYTDTPMLPHCPYKVHDADRPQPRVVTPGTESSQAAPGRPPSDAVVLFDGKDLSGWTGKDGAAKWKVENGYMEVIKGTGSIWTSAEFGDCQLHVEWAAPSVVESESQGRGNSGVFLMRKYEIQVLDCHNNPTYADGTAAAIYGQYPPLVNACRKPGEWQTYDIVWAGPRFDSHGSVVRTAAVTILHNGVVVHHYAVLIGPTTHRKIDPWVAHPPVGALELQDHGNPVRYRNIWYRPILSYDAEA
jgi:hypothetical protein